MIIDLCFLISCMFSSCQGKKQSTFNSIMWLQKANSDMHPSILELSRFQKNLLRNLTTISYFSQHPGTATVRCHLWPSPERSHSSLPLKVEQCNMSWELLLSSFYFEAPCWLFQEVSLFSFLHIRSFSSLWFHIITCNISPFLFKAVLFSHAKALA